MALNNTNLFNYFVKKFIEGYQINFEFLKNLI